MKRPITEYICDGCEKVDKDRLEDAHFINRTPDRWLCVQGMWLKISEKQFKHVPELHICGDCIPRLGQIVARQLESVTAQDVPSSVGV